MTDLTWKLIGNWLLVAFTGSYLCSLALFLLLRPRDALQWATTLKIGSIAAVGLNGCLVLFFGIGTDQPLRVIVFACATFCCWAFTILAWREWIRRRVHDKP